MDYEYENAYIFDEWPDIEINEELESDEFYISKTKTSFSFVISKNDFVNPPFSLALELHDAKDFPHTIGIIICIKSLINESDFRLYTHCYLKYTKDVRSLVIQFPSVSFKQTDENISHYKKIWQENQLQLFFKVKHWTSVPYSILNLNSNNTIHTSTLLKSHSTCYLNAIISILYNIPEFRNLIFSAPDPSYSVMSKSIPKELGKNLEIDPPDDSIFRTSPSITIENISNQKDKKKRHHKVKCVRSVSLRFGSPLIQTPQKHIIYPIIQALQRLFAMMNNQCKCSTRVLTESFGWPEKALDIQHDAEEFLSGFLNKLKEKLPASLETSFIELFYGIERVYKITKDEQGGEKTETSDQQFSIIPIKNINQCKSLDSGLKYYFQDDIMDKITIRNSLVKLPKILSFQICRFDNLSKNSSYFSYSRHINMTKYMVNSNSREKILSPPNYLYRLFAVVVHKGDSERGHYYSYVSPTTDFQWFKFDDSMSTKVENPSDVFTNNFGIYNPSISSSRPTAYILMYIRLDCIEEVLGMDPPKRPPFNAEDYANKILRNVTKENQKIELNVETYITIEIINKESLEEALNSGSSINFLGVKPWISLSLSGKTTQKEIYQKVNEILNKDNNSNNNENDSDNNIEYKFRLWKCDNNKFPRYAVYDNKTAISSFSKSDRCLYIEFTSDQFMFNPKSPSYQPIFNYIFFVFFDPLICIKEHTNFERIKFLLSIEADKDDLISNKSNEILNKIKELNLVPRDSEPKLHFFKEEGNNYFMEIRPNNTFLQNRVTIGSFIYVQAFTDQKEPDFSLPSEVSNYMNSIDSSESSIKIEPEKEGGTEVSLFKTMGVDFPLSLSNIFSMFNHSLRFNVFSFGYMNCDKFYSIRVPCQMKLVDFKRYLAKIFGDEYNPMLRTDHVQIFKVPRLKTPLIVSVADNPNHAIEITNIFGKEALQDTDGKIDSMSRMNNSNISIDEGTDNDDDDDIELIDDIYVQIDHNISSKCVFKRVSFSVDAIFPTFSFQFVLPNSDCTVEDLFNNFVAPKLISIVMNKESKEYESSDYECIRKLIESQTTDGNLNLKYDPTILRVLLIQNLIVVDENLNIKSRIFNSKQEIRFEIIPKDQKASPLIPVSLAAPFAPTAVTGAGHPFMISVDGTEAEIKERLQNVLNRILMDEELQSKESIISLAFGKKSGEIISFSKIEELNLGLAETHDESASTSSEIFSLSSMDPNSVDSKRRSQKFETNVIKIIEHIKVAQKQKLILFVINNGLNPNNFTNVYDFYHVLKIFS